MNFFIVFVILLQWRLETQTSEEKSCFCYVFNRINSKINCKRELSHNDMYHERLPFKTKEVPVSFCSLASSLGASTFPSAENKLLTQAEAYQQLDQLDIALCGLVHSRYLFLP